LVPYKRVDLIVEAFTQMPDRELVVICQGPEAERIAAIARGHRNIRLLGYQPHEILQQLTARARAFVFASIEDFGIAPVEAQACGTPVIALGKGGSLETVRPLGDSNPTGVYFEEQTVPSLMQAVEEFERESGQITPIACRNNAERFAPEIFRDKFARFVDEAVRSVEESQYRHDTSFDVFTGNSAHPATVGGRMGHLRKIL
jgi:glycosyltransferase involved in cell wall biosynthesis